MNVYEYFCEVSVIIIYGSVKLSDKYMLMLKIAV